MNVRILSFIVAGAGFLSAFNVVHAGDRRDISALVEDLKTVAPSKNQHLGNSHYVTTNEARHDHFQKAISGLGGAYLGVGTNQNFEMIGWSRPQVAVMVDFDQMVVDMHHIYRLVFSHAETPDAFVELWAPKNLSTMLSLIDQNTSDQVEKNRVVRARKYARERAYSVLKAARARYQKRGVKSYLNDQEQYDYVRGMFKAGAIVPLRVDLTGPKALRRIGDILRKHGVQAKTVYISNCEQYFKYTSDFRQNMKNLPVAEDSLLLRTRVWREFLPGTRKAQGPQHYTYIYQRMNNFNDWLADRRVTNVNKIIKRPRINDRPIFFESRPK